MLLRGEFTYTGQPLFTNQRLSECLLYPTIPHQSIWIINNDNLPHFILCVNGRIIHVGIYFVLLFRGQAAVVVEQFFFFGRDVADKVINRNVQIITENDQILQSWLLLAFSPVSDQTVRQTCVFRNG